MLKSISNLFKTCMVLLCLSFVQFSNAQSPGPGVDPDAVMLDDFESGNYDKWNTRPGSRGELMSFELMDAAKGDKVRFGNYALKVNIDFTHAQAQQTLVAQITPASGDLQIPGNAGGGKRLGMWLYATEGVKGMWVRVSTRPIGATSGVTNTDLAAHIDWTGWKYVECDLPAGHEFHPDCIRFVVLKDYENYYVNDYVIIDNIRVTNKSFTEDKTAPVISALTGNGQPLEGTYDTSKIDISASFEDPAENSSGINYESAVIDVDGNEFKAGDSGFSIEKQTNTVSLSGLNLSNGVHNATVRIEDNFGNIAQQNASFTIDASDGRTTMVTMDEDEKVYVGTPYYLYIKTNNPKDIKELQLVLSLNNIGSVNAEGGVEFASSAQAGSKYEFNARDGRLSVNLVNNEATATEETLATVKVNISKNSNPTDVLRLSPVSAKAVYADNSLSLFSLFEAFSKNVTATYDFTVNKRVVGLDGEIAVTDMEGNPVSGATVYALSEDKQTVLESVTTDGNGLASGMKFTATAQAVNIYAEKDGKYSYTRLIRTLNPLLTATPEFIRSGTTPDPLTQKTITWMSNPLLSAEGSYAKVAKKSDGEAAFTQVEGKTKLLEYNAVLSNGVAKGNVVTMTGLEPNTTYIYQVGDGENWSPTREFTTAKETDEFSFNAFGDLQASSTSDMSRYIAAAKTIEEMDPQPLFNLNVGDVVDSDDRFDYYTYYGYLFNQQPAFSNIDIISGYGNHEYMGNADADNCKFINGHHSVEESDKYDASKVGTGTYAVEYGNMIVLSLDWEQRGDSGLATELLQEEMKWADEVLSNTDKTWKVISLHYPIYPGESTPGSQDIFDPILSKHNVQLVLCGHGHTYERVQIKDGENLVPPGDRRTFEPAIGGTMHIQLGDMTSTGRNARWLHCDVDGKKMEVTVRDANNEIVENECFTLYAAELGECKVDFSVAEGKGSLSATVDGSAITSGQLVEECKDVVFEAVPEDGYEVKSWIVNGQETVSDATSYTISGISEDMEVEVTFEKSAGTGSLQTGALTVYPNPCIDNVRVEGAENSLLKITDISGSVLMTHQVVSNSETIPMSGFSDGFYLFLIEKDGLTNVVKVAKRSK